jgi:hypothetical protein
MIRRQLRLTGPDARGTVVNATALRDLLNAVIDGSQRAVRIRTQGRSAATGPLPEWIAKSTDFRVELKEGSTILEFTGPTLLEANPEEFTQQDLFPEIDPSLSSFDYFAQTLEAALLGEDGAELFDRSLLKALRRDFEPVFAHGIETVEVPNVVRERPLKFAQPALVGFSVLERQIPKPQQVRLAGKLDQIRHSDRTFILVLRAGHERVRGSVPAHLAGQLQELWSREVLVSGTAHFTANGGVQLVEADSLSSASERDQELWSVRPEPLEAPRLVAGALRTPQGPRSGLAAILGRWPGEEDDDQVAEALGALS